jgi:uncharacterized protein YutE (UPF0331/DUF86 family)
MDDIIRNKITIIERCLVRVIQEYAGDPVNLQDLTRQDSMILNIQRACEAAIGLAMHLIALRRLGIPQNSREAFDFLEREGMITTDLALRLKAMVGFRNIAIHDYQAIKLEILQKIITDHLQDFRELAERMRKV